MGGHWSCATLIVLRERKGPFGEVKSRPVQRQVSMRCGEPPLVRTLRPTTLRAWPCQAPLGRPHSRSPKPHHVLLRSLLASIYSKAFWGPRVAPWPRPPAKSPDTEAVATWEEPRFFGKKPHNQRKKKVVHKEDTPLPPQNHVGGASNRSLQREPPSPSSPTCPHGCGGGVQALPTTTVWGIANVLGPFGGESVTRHVTLSVRWLQAAASAIAGWDIGIYTGGTGLNWWGLEPGMGGDVRDARVNRLESTTIRSRPTSEGGNPLPSSGKHPQGPPRNFGRPTRGG